MKRYACVFIFSILIVLSFNSLTSYAIESKQGTFVGTITAKNDFYYGDRFLKDNFVIDGYLLYDGIKYTTDELNIGGEALGGDNAGRYFGYVSYQKNGVYIYDKFLINTTVLSKEIFNPRLSYNFDNFVIDYEDLISKELKEMFTEHSSVKNSLGNHIVYTVSNDYYLDYTKLKYGYTKVNYTISDDISNYAYKYDRVKGVYFVYRELSKNKIKVNSTSIKINGIDKKITQLKLDSNDWTSSTTIKNLSPSTSYKLQIRQLVNDEWKIIYSGTVTTKSK